MNIITFLGPLGATFSHEAYDLLAETFDAPQTYASGTFCDPASKNIEIPEKICKLGGYGAIAMETLAEARVAESLEGFIKLLRVYGLPGNTAGLPPCPIHISGAVQLELHFCLMVHPEADMDAIDNVCAHIKAVGACRNTIGARHLHPVDVPSNGEGARLVAQDPAYRNYAALGPRSAAEKYGLKIIEEKCEDRKAVTTFFLIAPTSHTVSVGDQNRVMIVFRLPHRPGSLVHALTPFASLNMIQIHSVHTGNHSYDFAIELDVARAELESYRTALAEFSVRVERSLTFGPFEMTSR
jgi:prephenate dehydratase